MQHEQKPLFRGVATALVTPFHKSGIDYDALEGLIERQLSAGVAALVLAGTTGEASTLSERELGELIAFSKRAIRGRVPLIAGCGSNSTAHAVHLAELVAHAGADMLLAVAPYYNRPTSRGLLCHFSAIADATSLPLMLYNVPSRTGVSIGEDVLEALSYHPRVVAIKEADGQAAFARLTALLTPRMHIYAGNDDRLLDCLAAGGAGVISVLSNLTPTALSRVCTLYDAGRRDEAEALFSFLSPLIPTLFSESNPIPVKYLLFRMGLYGAPEYRLPLCAPSPETIERLEEVLCRLSADRDLFC